MKTNRFTFLMALMIAVASVVQNTYGEEPIKVTYRKSYEWYEPYFNMPLCSRYFVYKTKTYADGQTETKAYGFHYKTSSNFVATSYGAADGNYPTGYYKLEDGTEILYGEKNSDIDYAFPHQDDNGKDGNLIKVFYTKVGVPDISKLSLKEPVINDFWDRRNLSTYKSPIYIYQGSPLYFDYQNPIEGWYFTGNNEYQYSIELLYDNMRIRKYTTFGTFFYDMFLYLDEQIFDFADHKATYDVDLRVSDTTMPDGSPAKVFTFEVKMKYLGRDFYSAVVDTVYQLPSNNNQ